MGNAAICTAVNVADDRAAVSQLSGAHLQIEGCEIVVRHRYVMSYCDKVDGISVQLGVTRPCLSSGELSK